MFDTEKLTEIFRGRKRGRSQHPGQTCPKGEKRRIVLAPSLDMYFNLLLARRFRYRQTASTRL